MGNTASKAKPSKVNRESANSRKLERRICCMEQSSSVDGLSSLERPLGVQEALFDRRLMDAAKRADLEQLSWTKFSGNITVDPKAPCTFHRYPVAQRTDLARAGLPMEHGLHLWKFNWPIKQRGTHAVIGVCTEATPLFARGYTHLLGSTKNSWGWDLSKRGLYHGGKRSRYEYPNQTQRPLEQIPTVVVMIVDMDKGTVAFEVDSRYQGIAFTGLKGQTVYAAASAVWGNCQVEMKYLGSTYPGEVKPLMTLARNSIRKAMGARRIADGCVEELVLPDIVKVYINCKLPQQYAVMEEGQRFDVDNNVQQHAAAVAAFKREYGEPMEEVSSPADQVPETRATWGSAPELAMRSGMYLNMEVVPPVHDPLFPAPSSTSVDSYVSHRDTGHGSIRVGSSTATMVGKANGFDSVETAVRSRTKSESNGRRDPGRSRNLISSVKSEPIRRGLPEIPLHFDSVGVAVSPVELEARRIGDVNDFDMVQTTFAIQARSESTPPNGGRDPVQSMNFISSTKSEPTQSVLPEIPLHFESGPSQYGRLMSDDGGNFYPHDHQSTVDHFLTAA
ncbi:uncharacterized protein LOC135818518 [Sycon ciliatum]|uniref:uncharacterized protein LOC135818518 n=1 Tax=Sycon ciliatum TaxID=27933 RepID=UPI0031F708F8|eukprot:scpid60401/ scgid4429/ SPRY domain-containing SOCS box protein 4